MKKTKKISSSTPNANTVLETALVTIPQTIKDRIISSFIEVQRRYLQAIYTDASYDSFGLSAGKFCEAVFRSVQFSLTGTFVAFGTQINDFAGACRKLEQQPATVGSESLRVIIPRGLLFAYTIRNKRGIGHTGGDVDANRTDMTAVYWTVMWLICELIRIHHGMSLEDAQALVDSLNTRHMPVVWEVMGRKRVLQTNLSFKEKSLLVLYTSQHDGILIEDLFESVEYSNMSVFKRDVVKPLHKAKLVEYDKETESLFISPIGCQMVENVILKK